MDELKQLLYEESRFRISDELFDRFVGLMVPVPLRNREVLIPTGRLDTNVYILSSGIVRCSYFDGEKERTHAFAAPGTMIISYPSFHMRLPSYFQFESCGESVVLKISKREVDELMESSTEFSQWMFSLAINQLYYYEYKLAVINGTACDRYLSLIRNRPEITARVPLKVIASYLGVTPTYLCRLKKELQQKGKSI